MVTINETSSLSHVVIVGAGPAGLMLATNLVRYGIKPIILDDRLDKTSTGRADGLQPKTIETFRQLGLADDLLRKGVRIHDICFWNSSATETLHRTQREIHYPASVVDLKDPFILLVHQGMVEEVFLEDLAARGVHVRRSSPFVRYSNSDQGVHVEYSDLVTGQTKTLCTNYLIGCDGAHSLVRKSIPGADMEGESGKSSWGVLDGVLRTDFPDIWSKVVIQSESGSVLCIPRERNMTRLYIELQSSTTDTSSQAATEEFVMSRAKAIMAPFQVSWETVEWFGVYKVGQRVAKQFFDEQERVFIAGDAAHTHSPKAAQGMNVSMHDTFNLAWKLNLAIRSLASPTLLSTYSLERRQIAQDLIAFDYEHANAFSNNDPAALAANFAKNVRFISGVGAEYTQLPLTVEGGGVEGGLRAGALLLPARVTRYIDANPVDLQLDIPMLGQFRIFFFTHDVHAVHSFLSSVCQSITSSTSTLGRVSAAATYSYAEHQRIVCENDEYVQPGRYTSVSPIVTLAAVTTMAKEKFEIADLPPALQDSQWTLYLDDIGEAACSSKWVGKFEKDEVVIINVRPDGYVGALQKWQKDSAGEAAGWLDSYYAGIFR